MLVFYWSYHVTVGEVVVVVCIVEVLVDVLSL